MNTDESGKNKKRLPPVTQEAYKKMVDEEYVILEKPKPKNTPPKKEDKQ